MSHRGNHLLPCVFAAIVAVALLAAFGANPIAAGVGAAFLICPIVMGTVMWLLMRQPKHSTPDAQSQTDSEPERATVSPRS